MKRRYRYTFHDLKRLYTQQNKILRPKYNKKKKEKESITKIILDKPIITEHTIYRIKKFDIIIVTKYRKDMLTVETLDMVL